MTPPRRTACKQEARGKFLAEMDVLRLSMASNLSDYRMETAMGQVTRFVPPSALIFVASSAILLHHLAFALDIRYEQNAYEYLSLF